MDIKNLNEQIQKVLNEDTQALENFVPGTIGNFDMVYNYERWTQAWIGNEGNDIVLFNVDDGMFDNKHILNKIKLDNTKLNTLLNGYKNWQNADAVVPIFQEIIKAKIVGIYYYKLEKDEYLQREIDDVTPVIRLVMGYNLPHGKRHQEFQPHEVV